MSEIETRLNEFNFSEAAASIYSKCHFRCQYCGFDGLSSVDAYWSLQVDHILPKSKYPQFKDDKYNLVITCSVCNNLKGTFDPSKGGGKYTSLDKKDHDILINKCRDYIFEKRAEQTKIFLELKELVFNHYQS